MIGWIKRRIGRIALGISLTLVCLTIFAGWFFFPTLEATKSLLQDNPVTVDFKNVAAEVAIEELERKIRNSSPRLRFFRIYYSPKIWPEGDPITDWIKENSKPVTVTLSVSETNAFTVLIYMSQLTGRHLFESAGFVEFHDRSKPGPPPVRNWWQSYVQRLRPDDVDE